MIRNLLLIIVLLASLLVGCEGESERVARMATQAAERQAAQNEQMAKLNREVAAGTKRLVEQDAAARRELTGVHREIQAERSVLWGSWNDLESERQQIASDRRTTSALSDIFRGGSALLIAVVCLAFCWLLLVAARTDPEVEATVCELLLQERLGGESDASAAQLDHSEANLPRQLTESDVSEFN